MSSLLLSRPREQDKGSLSVCVSIFPKIVGEEEEEEAGESNLPSRAMNLWILIHFVRGVGERSKVCRDVCAPLSSRTAGRA